MNLHEHEEFRDALNATAADGELDVRFVEKDYYVTEMLRTISVTLPDRIIFKGGTSLSKGWKLIDRFSEDIDLFLDRTRWDPPLGGNGVDTVLRRLRDAVGAHPAFTYLLGEGRTIGGFSREDNFAYATLFDELPGMRSVVRLEPGVQSGNQPTEGVEISAIVADFLRGRGDGDMADDLQPFPMTLLHFRRTFVEKLFTIHSKVERLKQDGHLVGRDTRHYADLHVLASRDEVHEMLRTDEYEQIKLDYDRVSREYFPDSYRPPANLSFRDSDALFPSEALRAQIEPDYDTECRRLFPASYPSLDEVFTRLGVLKDLL